MASSVASSLPHDHAIQRSFNLLCDYLNLGGEHTDAGAGATVRFMLRSSFVQPFFDEYARDYLARADEVEDIDYPALRLAVANHQGRYDQVRPAIMKRKRLVPTGGVRNPDKTSWSAVDHAARFVIQTLRYSWRHGGPWDHGKINLDSDDGDLEFWQVWLVLRHMQAEWEADNIEDWTEEGLVEVFNQFHRKF
ncbi:hypothetical protein LQW54_010229 [Pestalotiopsis sp. IQ-011]